MFTNDSSRNKFIFNIILLFKKKINKILYMLKELRDLLMKIVNDIDSGNSNIDESQTIEIASAIGELVSRYNKPKIPNKLTRLEACKHLRVSETKFNMLRRKGLISEGTKKAGDVRKWSIEELDKYIKDNSQK